MIDTKFTPGPWVVDGDDQFAMVFGSDGWVIAETDHIHAGDSPDSCDVHLANMRLIAAAPDLLAFVQQLQIEYAAFHADDSKLYPERLMSHASLAAGIIAKATGVAESPDE